jgi:hypothetical protein
MPTIESRYQNLYGIRALAAVPPGADVSPTTLAEAITAGFAPCGRSEPAGRKEAL